ncbi:MAG TPA: hypothetical protein VM075_04950 [Anaerolineae bacterium]|nr:hypothetical protein [Anaerolineae bacterium]
MPFLARLEDGEEELAYQLEAPVNVIGTCFSSLNLTQQMSQAVDGDPLEVFRRPTNGQSLQSFSDVVDLFVVRNREPCYSCAATWVECDKAFRLQLAQGLADWHRTDAKGGGQVFLTQVVARPELALEDHVPDSVDDGLVDIAVLD